MDSGVIVHHPERARRLVERGVRFVELQQQAAANEERVHEAARLVVETAGPDAGAVSVDETNGPAIHLHGALGFTPSGYVDNLPQGTRELLFYRRVPPRRI